jgi:hypothetical protein
VASSVAVGEARSLGSVRVAGGDWQAGHGLAQGGDGIIVQALRETSPSTRPILLSTHATARDSQRALEQVLSKPFDAGELLQAVDSAAQSAGGFSASLHGISIVDMLQMFHYSRRSLTMRVLGIVPAAIHMRDGELVHAEYAERRGEEAIAAILKMPAGAIRTSALESVKTTVQRKLQTVLLDQLRQQDEDVRDPQAPQPREVSDDMFGFLSDEEVASGTDASKAWGPASRPPGESSSPGTSVPAPRGSFAPARAVLTSATSGERPIVRLAGKKRTLEKIDLACERVVRSLEGCVACGVIDLDTCNVLGIFHNGDYSEQQSELVAEATVDLFRRPKMQRIEAMIREQRADHEHAEHYFEEIQLASKHNLHFVQALAGGRAVILLVTERSTSLRLSWDQLKAAIPVLERLIP